MEALRYEKDGNSLSNYAKISLHLAAATVFFLATREKKRVFFNSMIIEIMEKKQCFQTKGNTCELSHRKSDLGEGQLMETN